MAEEGAHVIVTDLDEAAARGTTDEIKAGGGSAELRDTGRLSVRGERTRVSLREAHARRADADEIGRLVGHLVRGGDALLNGAIITADAGYPAHR
jgi:NAD(P)-dependent dehydrogenase (short-subunit alcohol dehydrogenase family)